MRRGIWTEERKDELRLLWLEPLSLDAIADQLSTSRDMVALWGARLGLPKRHSFKYDGTWLEEDVADLKRLWAAGHSGSEIMRALDFRHSRNGVIGKVHRLNLAGRAVKAREPRPSRARGPRPKKRAAVAYLAPHLRPKPRPAHIDLVPPEALMIPLLQLNDHTCKYTLGEATGAAQLFCGTPKDIEVSWCSYHCRIVFQPDYRKTTAAKKLEMLAA